MIGRLCLITPLRIIVPSSLEDVGLDSEVEVFKAEVFKIEASKTEVPVLFVKIVV